MFFSQSSSWFIVRCLTLATVCLTVIQFVPNLVSNSGYSSSGKVEAFIFWKAHTTACEMEICDGIDTYSGRNMACCLIFSKCCGYVHLCCSKCWMFIWYIFFIVSNSNLLIFMLNLNLSSESNHQSYKSIDEAEMIRANITGTTPIP